MDMDSWQAWSGWAASKGISIITWSISDKAETCSMFTPEASSEGPWKDEVIKPWGTIVKNWL
jgi:endoglucanase